MKVKRGSSEIAFATVACTQVPIVVGAFFLAHFTYKKCGFLPFVIYAGAIIGFSFVAYAYFSLTKRNHDPNPW